MAQTVLHQHTERLGVPRESMTDDSAGMKGFDRPVLVLRTDGLQSVAFVDY